MSSLLPFERVLETHGAEIYRFLRRHVADPTDTADLHQETFLRAYRAYGRLEPGANVRAWLYRIAANLVRDARRRSAVRGGAATDGPDPIAGAASDPHRRVEANELRAAVRAGLAGLPWRQRTAVAARVFEGLDYATIAAMLDCSEVTARQHVSQGLRRLRASLAPALEVPA